MSAGQMNTGQTQAPQHVSGRKELLLLATLALVQFTVVVDFLVMAPLGPKLMKLWGITTQQFGLAVSAYVFTAGICGFLGAFFIDKFDRKRVVTFAFAGFTLGTIACGLAPSYLALVAARVFTGVFGGIMGTMVFAIIADALPLERRGRSFGVVTASFSLASIFGVPGGLYFANVFDWHAPFLILGGLAVIVQFFIAAFIPNVTAHLNAPPRNPIQIIQGITTDRNQLRALLLVMCLSIGQFSVLPFITPYLVTNVGLSEAQLPLLYLVGGICTVITSPIIGILSDKFDKRIMYTIAALISIIPIFLITNFAAGVSLVIVFAASSLMFMTINGRMIPGMATVQGTVTPQNRGSFTSISTATQQVSSGLATFGAGFLVHKGTDGLLINYNIVGFVAIAFTILSILIIRGIRQVEVSHYAAFAPKAQPTSVAE